MEMESQILAHRGYSNLNVSPNFINDDARRFSSNVLLDGHFAAAGEFIAIMLLPSTFLKTSTAVMVRLHLLKKAPSSHYGGAVQ